MILASVDICPCMLLFFLLLGRWVKEKCARSRTKGPGSRRRAWWTSWTNTDAGTGAFVTLRRAFTLYVWLDSQSSLEFSTRLTRYFKSTKLQGDWNVFLLLVEKLWEPCTTKVCWEKVCAEKNPCKCYGAKKNWDNILLQWKLHQEHVQYRKDLSGRLHC